MAPGSSRPWHRVWPAHLAHSLHYPSVPAWWLLERNVVRFGDRVALRELDHASGLERRALTYAELWRAVQGTARGLGAHGVTAGSRIGFDGSILPDDTETSPPLDLAPNLRGNPPFLGFLTSTTKGLPGVRTLLSLSSLPSQVNVILSLPLNRPSFFRTKSSTLGFCSKPVFRSPCQPGRNFPSAARR